MRPQVLLALALFAALASAQCPYTGLPGWTASGFASSGDVVVPAGVSVQFDLTGTVAFNSIIVQGVLAFADVDVSLSLNFLKVNDSGKLLLGSPTCPLTKRIVITLVGSRTTLNPIGQEGGALGAKGIVGTTGATVEIFGNPPGLIWTRLQGTASANATTITLQETPTGWAVGNRVLITTTDFATIKSQERYFPDDNEVRVITAISGKTLTLDAPLNSTHWGIWPENAEVAVLDRNIVIQGDAGAEEPISGAGFGGHFLVRDNNSNMRIDGVEFTRMGQTGVVGRYPVHFHLMGDKVGQNNYVKRCSIHDNFQRCLVVHDTNGVLLENNVAYSTIGHCYFMEDGSEMYNTWNKNLGVKVTSNDWSSGPFTRVIPSDVEPVIFWITNMQNTWTNNVAVGNATFGYWASLPVRPNGVSAAKYANSEILPRLLPLIAFDNNTVHSVSNNGFHCDDGQLADQTIEGTVSWSPSTGPYNTTRNGFPVIADFSDIRAFKCRGHGIWMRGVNTRWNRLILIDNGRGMDTVPGPHLIKNSYFECESANPGNARQTPWTPVFGRSRPYWWSPKVPVCGFEHYDASGPVFLDTNTFVNCQSNSVRNASAHCMQRNTKNIHQPSFRLINQNYVNSNIWFLERWPNAYDQSPEQDNVKGAVVLDTDGTSYGIAPNAWAVTPADIITYGLGCTFRSDWQMALCPPFREGFGFLQVTNTDPTNTDFKNTNVGVGKTDPYWYRGAWFGLGDYNGERRLDVVGMDIDSVTRTDYRINVPLRRGYTLRFANDHPTPPQLTVQLDAIAEGEWAIIALPYPTGLTFTVTRGSATSPSPVTPAASLSDLSGTTYFYDTTSKHLFIRVQALDDSISNRLGAAYVSYTSYNARVSVQASCSRSSCLGPNLGIPAPVPLREDQYVAALQACQVSPAITYTGNGQGVAYFSLDPVTKLLTYNIYHNLGSTVTSGGIYNAASGSTGPLVASLPQLITPMRGSISLTHSMWTALSQGKLYVSLSTATFPTGLLRGQIGCDTSAKACQYPPPAKSAVDMCNTPGTSPVNIYTDDLASNGRASWSWSGAIISLNSTAAAACGTYGISYSGNSRAFASGPAYQAPPITLQPSQFLQFLVKNPNWPAEVVDIGISFTDTNDASSTTVYVASNPDWVDNYAISNEWTRVKIPLTAFKISASYPFKTITFRSMPYNTVRSFYLDEIRFITDAAEPTSAPMAASAIVNYACACGSCPATSPPLVTAGPAPPPSPGSGTPSGAVSSGTSTSGNVKGSSKSSVSGALIGGIVAGVLVAALVIAGLAYYLAYWRPRHNTMLKV